MDLDGDGDTIEDFLHILEEHLRSCELQGKYAEAEVAKNRLDELRRHEENRRKEEVRSRQIAERLGVEEAHMVEFQNFNQIWGGTMAEYESQAEKSISATKKRHEDELLEHQKKLLQQYTRPKYSRKVLDLRSKQEHLAKARHYSEAHKLKLKSNALETVELEKFHKKRKEEMLAKEQQFKRSKAIEMQALFKRIESGRLDQKKQHKMDFDKLLRRYANIRKTLEGQQSLEMMRLERSSKASSPLRSRRKVKKLLVFMCRVRVVAVM